MIRDIFVPLLDNAADQRGLAVATSLAEFRGAHVSALVTESNAFPLVSEFGYVPMETMQQQADLAHEHAEALVARARELLARSSAPSEVRLARAVLWSEETAALHARHADISIIAKPALDDGSPRFDLTFNNLLLHSGRPVMMVPQEAAISWPLARIVIAWKPTTESTRALHDALALLDEGVEIELLMIDPKPSENLFGEEPGADIARHLVRQGFKVRVLSLASEGRSDGENILRHADAVGACLLVMGGYGHSRWRELVLGGATRTVRDHARLPVLFSH